MMVVITTLLVVCSSPDFVSQNYSSAVRHTEGQVAGTESNRGELLTLRGKRLYVEILGSKDAPPLLYLHGGPGAGVYDFGFHQGTNLSKNFRLIMMDQRGVLRSDPIEENEPFGLDDIIEDAEALREHLAIKRWSVIGHSFGAYVAVRYATLYPAAIQKLILESPTLDLASTNRSLLRGVAAEYRLKGNTEAADKAASLISSQLSSRELWQGFTKLINGLGDSRFNLYMHGPNKKVFLELVASSGLSQELWSRQETHQRKLFTEGKVFESLIPSLVEIQCPVLLIRGKYDYVTAADQVRAFKQKVRRGKVITFKNSSHFPRVEEPAHYAEVVTKFLQR